MDLYIFKNSYINNPNLHNIRTEDNIRNWQNPDVRRKRIEGKSKPLVQLDLEGNLINEFLNSSIAAKFMGAKDGSAIRACCRGDKTTYKGFIWMYKSEYEKLNDKSA